MTVRPSGERLPLLLRADGVPAHFPTCLILEKRSKGVASSTLESMAQDLLHLQQTLLHIGLRGFESRLLAGDYFDCATLQDIADACSAPTGRLRALNSKNVTRLPGSPLHRKDHAVTNQVKHRRITTIGAYIDMVARTGEHNLSDEPMLVARSLARKKMVQQLLEMRPQVKSHRRRLRHSNDDLGNVVAFILYGDPTLIWSNETICKRNWAIVSSLVQIGTRAGELRKAKSIDVDTNANRFSVMRRPDDPDYPRPREPNTKTADRQVPIGHDLSERLDDYQLNAGSDAAASTGTPYLFLTHGPNSCGQPISRQVVAEAVKRLGEHLGISGLNPHALRSAWVQKTVNWAIANDLSGPQFDRLLNYLGGWSYFSKQSSDYLGDHLVRTAYEAGVIVEGKR